LKATNKQKQDIREHSLAVREELSARVDFVLESSSGIAAQLLAIPEVQSILKATENPPLFASYAPSKGEPNPNGFLDDIESDGGVRPMMAFPRISGKGQLSMHFAVLEKLLPGSFGILEPGADLPLANPSDIDVMLVPGVAFDYKGNRLGYGKGYYDRLLSNSLQGQNSHRPLLVGVSFDETLYDELPTEAHDKGMDYIVTPTQTLCFLENSD